MILTGCSDSVDPALDSSPSPTPTQSGSTPLASIVPTDRAHEALIHAEYFDRYHACLSELGILVAPSGDGGFVVDPGAGGDAALLEAEAECKVRLGDPPEYMPLTREEVVRLYDAELTAMACLESHGYVVDDPPSLEEYIESYLVDQDGVPPWSSYLDVLDPTEIEDACPQPTLE